MTYDLSQIALTAIVTAITSSGATLTTLILGRYLPRALDRVENKLKKKGD